MYEITAGHDLDLLTTVPVDELGMVFEPGELDGLDECQGPVWDEVEARIAEADAQAAWVALDEALAPADALLDEVLDEFDALDQVLLLDQAIEQAGGAIAPVDELEQRRARRGVAQVLRDLDGVA